MRLKRVFVGQLMAGVCISGPCLAQSAPGAASGDSATLEEVIVTAQRQAQSLQDVPIAVSVVSAAEMAARGVTDTRGIALTVPNLTLTENGVSVTPYLRGVGSNQSNPNDEPSVATYVDGIYVASPTGNIFSFNSIERIEVLKGPQGTLFGRNATGGVIQIVTRDPRQDPSLEAKVSYADYDTVEAAAYGTIGLAPGLAGDLALIYNKNADGYGRDIHRNADILKHEEFAARTKFLWSPTAQTEVRLTADYSHLDSTGTDYQLAQGVVGADGVTSYPGKRRTNTDFANTGDNEVYGAGLRIDHDLGFARFASLTGYRHVVGDFHLDQDATPTPIVRAEINQFAETWSQELQLLSPVDSKVEWLLGAYYFHGDFAYRPLRIGGFAAAPLPALDLVGSQETKSASAFGQASVPVFAATKLTIGLRYTNEKQSTVGHVETGGVVIVPDIPQKQDFNKLTWRLSLDHEFSSDVLGYVSYNRGIKSGGFNMINAGTPGYAPEILDAYEVGLKTQLFGRTVRLNTAGFFYKYKDIQVFNITGGGAVLTTNAAAAEVWGLDADLAWRPSRNLSLAAGLGLLNTEYTRFPNALFTPASPLQGPATIGSAKGNELSFAPDVSANLSADYTIPSSIGEFRLSAAAYYRDDVFVTADNRLKIPAYTVVNASVGWTSQSGRYGVQVWARNLFDEDYYANRTEQALGDIQYLAAPRVVGVTLSARM